MLSRIRARLKNFYVATAVGLFLWMLLFDANDLRSQLRNWWKLRELKGEKAYYEEHAERLEAERREVLGNRDLRVKFAREHYLMKKPTEDVYVIVDENNELIEK